MVKEAVYKNKVEILTSSDGVSCDVSDNERSLVMSLRILDVAWVPINSHVFRVLEPMCVRTWTATNI